MRICFYGRYDEFIGLANACKDSVFAKGNPFEFFKENKVDVVLFKLEDFSRPLFKNLVKHKIPGICVSQVSDHKKIQQAIDAKIELKIVREADIVGFDSVRYPEGKVIVDYAEDVIWFPEGDLRFYHQLKCPNLKIYCEQPVPVPEYAGWPNDNLLPCIIKSAKKVLYYIDPFTPGILNPNEVSYNLLKILGCGGKIETNLQYVPDFRIFYYNLVAGRLGIL